MWPLRRRTRKLRDQDHHGDGQEAGGRDDQHAATQSKADKKQNGKAGHQKRQAVVHNVECRISIRHHAGSKCRGCEKASANGRGGKQSSNRHENLVLERIFPSIGYRAGKFAPYMWGVLSLDEGLRNS